MELLQLAWRITLPSLSFCFRHCLVLSRAGLDPSFERLLSRLRNLAKESVVLIEHKHLGVFQRPLTLILPQKYRDTNGSRIVIQIGGVYTTFCQEEGILLQKYAIEMGGVSRYFSKVSGSGVDLTLLKHGLKKTLFCL